MLQCVKIVLRVTNKWGYMVTKTQLFIKHDLFDTLNVHDIAMFSFRLNDEIVSPQMNEKQFQDFMSVNPKLSINELGQLIKDDEIYGIALEYVK
jgi:hypothetical protein